MPKYIYILAILLTMTGCYGLKSATVADDDPIQYDYTLVITMQDLPTTYNQIMETVDRVPCRIDRQRINNGFVEIWVWQIDYFSIETRKINQVTAALRRCAGVLNIQQTRTERIDD